jgi:putative cardiolipin synthase
VVNVTLDACKVLALPVAFLIAGCASLPGEIAPPEVSNALPPAQHGHIAAFASSCVERSAVGESCFLLLDDNVEDLRWRLALIDSAQNSIDIQTFIWARDFSGRLLASRVLAAADRGVRVRLLVDDFPTARSDRVIAVLDQHPNIYVRIWNPSRQRLIGRNLEYLVRLRELNHRLHNKVLVADNRAVISGGRNIADAYFGLSERFNFLDIDLLATGPVVPTVSAMFDRYWNSPQAVSGINFHSRASAEEIDTLRKERRQFLEASPLSAAVPVLPREWGARFDWALELVVAGKADVIYDKPGEPEPSQGALFGIQQWVRDARQEVLALNPYLVPGEQFFEESARLEARGVDMAIMTNSLGSTNQTIVHEAYARTRLPMLQSGIRLFEMKYQPDTHRELDTAPVRSSWVGLHAKCAVLDREQVFVGSYNLSPRSRNLNTEMGILVYSEALGAQLAAVIERAMAPENAWEVKLDAAGELAWVSAQGTLTRQPYQNFWRRIKSGLFGLFPVEQHL